MTIADEIFALFSRHGHAAYGERLSVTEHSLQAAYFARAAAAPASLVVAALLHDLGHLIGDAPQHIDDWHSDARHEEIAARWLAARFPPEVSEPVRLHVAAKRYLCATDRHYVAALSPASVITLRLQGGPLSPDEAARFELEPYHAAAVELRHWDDQGKIVGLVTPTLESYREWLEDMAVRPAMDSAAKSG